MGKAVMKASIYEVEVKPIGNEYIAKHYPKSKDFDVGYAVAFLLVVLLIIGVWRLHDK